MRSRGWSLVDITYKAQTAAVPTYNKVFYVSDDKLFMFSSKGHILI